MASRRVLAALGLGFLATGMFLVFYGVVHADCGQLCKNIHAEGKRTENPIVKTCYEWETTHCGTCTNGGWCEEPLVGGGTFFMGVVNHRQCASSSCTLLCLAQSGNDVYGEASCSDSGEYGGPTNREICTNDPNPQPWW
jgi:hypothetical protein